MNEFEGRRIVITGGAGGIGRATARELLSRGAEVHLIDISAGALDQAAAAMGDAGVPGLIQSDLASAAACRSALAAAGGPVHACIHMAGVFEEDPFDGEDRGIWDRAIAANLTNAYELAAAFPAVADCRQAARLVFASSVAFRRGSPDRVPYSAAKGGIVGLTRALSRRLAPDILVNAIAPGIIETPMPQGLIDQHRDRLLESIPLARFGRPEEVAGVIVFLCSKSAGYITGQTINIDGGMVTS